MKILVVPSWYPPNGGRFYKFQAEALAEKGHQVDVLILEEIGLSQKRNFKIEAKDSILVNEIRYKYYRLPKLNSLNIKLYLMKYKKIIKEYISRQKPDVIHAQSCTWAGVAVSEIALKNNIPYIISEQKSIFFKEKLPYNKKFSKLVYSAYHYSSHIIANSIMMKKSLDKYSDSQITVVPNLVDYEFFKPKKINTKKEMFTFITAGNLLPVKGYDILINAFSALYLETKKNIELKIIGKGKDLEKLKNLAKKTVAGNLLEKGIFFCGYKTKEELLLEYNYSNVYVSSSRMETFGMTIIEAMSCGLPVVATKSGGPQDIVNNENGYLAELNNAISLQSKMQKMLDNYSNFDSEKIRQNVINKYSKELVVNQIEKVLKKCLNNKKQLK